MMDYTDSTENLMPEMLDGFYVIDLLCEKNSNHSMSPVV
jgi:hypothetical protein